MKQMLELTKVLAGASLEGDAVASGVAVASGAVVAATTIVVVAAAAGHTHGPLFSPLFLQKVQFRCECNFTSDSPHKCQLIPVLAAVVFGLYDICGYELAATPTDQLPARGFISVFHISSHHITSASLLLGSVLPRLAFFALFRVSVISCFYTRLLGRCCILTFCSSSGPLSFA